MIKIICINGAPSVGKDTAGKLLKEIHGSTKIAKFATPLDEIAQNMLRMSNADYAEWRQFHKNNVPRNWGCTVTMRRLLITISENLVKPCFGPTWFAEECAQHVIAIKDNYKYIVVTDCGFQYEFDHFKSALNGIGHVRLINMTREGCTFEGDSREEVSDGDKTIYINNDGSIDELKQLLSLELFS